MPVTAVYAQLRIRAASSNAMEAQAVHPSGFIRVIPRDEDEKALLRVLCLGFPSTSRTARYVVLVHELQDLW